MDWVYIANMLGTAAFAASGIVAVRGTRIDIIGATVVAFVTAVGGGTVRDLLLDVPVFWLRDDNWLLVASLTGLVLFFGRNRLSRHGKTLDYLDAMGLALFASAALDKSLSLGLPVSHAVAMGVITGIGGGLIRDTLTSRHTLLVSPELYVTPILLGLLTQVASDWVFAIPGERAVLVGAGVIFAARSAAIHFDLHMPDFLINRPE